MKIFRKLLLLVPIAFFVIGVNFFGDVNMQFYRYSKIREICESFSQGYNIKSELVASINKRQLVKVNTDYRVPESIVLGSSRTMQLTGEILGEQDFYNDSVGYAVLEDYVGIMEMYAQHGFPDKVIIGVDPWVFNKNNVDTGVEQAKFWAGEVVNWKRRLGYDEKISVSEKYRSKLDLFSLAYFQDSLAQLFVDTAVDIVKEDDIEGDSVCTFEGVRISEEDNWNIPTEDSVTMSAKEMLQGKFYDFKEINAEKRELFEETIAYLQKHGVEVTILLIPFHPDMVEYFRVYLPVYLEIDEYLEKFADEYGITCYGSFEPDQCGVTGEYFYPDGVHIRELSAFKKIMACER